MKTLAILVAACILAKTYGLSCMECDYLQNPCPAWNPPADATCGRVRELCACCDSCGGNEGDECGAFATCREDLWCVGHSYEFGDGGIKSYKHVPWYFPFKDGSCKTEPQGSINE